MPIIARYRTSINNQYVSSGKSALTRWEGGGATVEPFSVRQRSKREAALLTLLRLGHYNEVKHLTPEWLAVAREALEQAPGLPVWCHMIYSLPQTLPALTGRPLLIDTHNSEWEWYGRMAEATRNPVARLICASSCRRSSAMARLLPTGAVMVHVSASDRDAYEQRRPDLAHFVLPNGCSLAPRASAPDYAAEGTRRLVFIGSLSVQMTSDALGHFAARFWPSLSERCSLTVAGSQPSEAVTALCSEHGWRLTSNPSDGELEALYADSHYAILPFTYGAGSKLKLLEACGRGVPVLATEAGICGHEEVPPLVTVSNEPADWRAAVDSRRSLDRAGVAATLDFAREFTWDQLVGRFADNLGKTTDLHFLSTCREAALSR